MKTNHRIGPDEWIDLTTAGKIAGLSPRVILLAVVSEEIAAVDTDAALATEWRLCRSEVESWVRRAQDLELALVG